MKVIEKIALGVCALALCGGMFFSCSNAAGDGSPNQQQPAPGGGTGQTQSSATVAYNEVWSGSQKIDWDANGVSIDHAKFTADFDSLRVTYNASAGAIKLSVCEPWTDITLTAASVSDGTIADDGAFNLPTGDNKTVTIKLSDADVAGIKGQEKDGAWGGVKIYGADTVTLLKVESFKAAASATPAPQPQAQAPAYTSVFEGSKTIDWGDSLTVDHAKFTAEFNAVRVTYNATAGAIKLAVSDKWKDITLTSASISAGSIADDGAFNLPTGDAQTVTIKLSDADVAGIKGTGTAEGGWGGLSIMGANTITITKVESFKQ
ncbi:MAG: hypothetical protein IJS51_06560 [Treponema sp.]|nr:hypothetical protein [Treponema sp.]